MKKIKARIMSFAPNESFYFDPLKYSTHMGCSEILFDLWINTSASYIYYDMSQLVKFGNDVTRFIIKDNKLDKISDLLGNCLKYNKSFEGK